MTRKICFYWMFAGIIIAGCSKSNHQEINQIDIRSKILASLENDEIRYWYPRVIDSIHGGYTERYHYDWTEDSAQDKYLVYETRNLWTTSMLYEFYKTKPEFLRYANHGFEFLSQKMWDSKEGGFYIATDVKGNPLNQLITEKRIYGQAFALYSLSRYFKVSGNKEALELAQKEFNWLEKGAHDPKNGGYWEYLYRNGEPIKEDFKIPPEFGDVKLAGLKDFNSSIHILEALTSLYKVWPDSTVRSRLVEMLNIINHTMIDPKGYLVQYFYGDWHRVPGNIMKEKTGSDQWLKEPVTFGHDIETAYLLIDAAESLGWNDSTVLPTAIKLTEHTIKFGWDRIYGGIFNDGLHIKNDSVAINDNHKAWWAEIEALNSFLLMSGKVPEYREKYYGFFTQQWNYIDTYLIDHEYGEFFNNGTDTDPDTKLNMKAHAWKGPYHTSRGLVNCIQMLEKED